MLPDRFAALLNLTGFLAALALYATLLAMVVRNPQAAMVSAPGRRPRTPPGAVWHERVAPDLLLLATAALGLGWNLVALWLYGFERLDARTPPAVAAVGFSALGFLPAVVVHGAMRPALAERRDPSAAALVALGYCLSTVAAALHLLGAMRGEPTSVLALRLLTFGFLALLILVAGLSTRQARLAAPDGGVQQAWWRRGPSLAALALFAVTALHLTEHEGLHDSWAIELAGHHASLPLALAILYQDYPFALADLFLKRVALVILALVLILAVDGVAATVLPGAPDPVFVTVLIGLGTGLAFAYPLLRRAADWFVDTMVLRRPDYGGLRAMVVQAIAGSETPEQVLAVATSRVAPSVAARHAAGWRFDGDTPVPLNVSPAAAALGEETVAGAYSRWLQSPHAPLVQLDPRKTAAVVIVPTAEAPRYALALGDLAGGRRLLSDDVSMLEAVALASARRIDVLRLMQERMERRLREAEIRQLATEAELRALRAQINPHFLFNALTTIGYLIQTAPPTAVEKLVQLTELLRRVLRSDGAFTTVGKELELVRLYLDLERARFEERLEVTIDVPEHLHDIPVPAFVLQPLVENAIKHGIAPAAAGGTIEIRAALDPPGGQGLVMTVRNTGQRVARRDGEAAGIGLSNIEQRLRHHYGEAASLTFDDTGPDGTLVTVSLPARVPQEIGGRTADTKGTVAGAGQAAGRHGQAVTR